MVLAQKQTQRLMEQNKQPRSKSHLYGQLLYNRGGKSIHWGKDSPFTEWWKTRQLHAKESNWTTFSHFLQK